MIPSKSGLASRAGVLVTALALSACGPGEEQEQREQKQTIKSQDACAPIGDNLVHDTSFSTLFARYSERQWHSSEHAAGGTYEPKVEDGVLSIRKIGDEPWFLVSQSADTSALAGSTIAFSAELKLDLHEPKHPHSFGYGGGLSVLAKRGNKAVLTSTIEHQPNFGVHDWQPVKLVFKLPKNTTYLRIGFVHQAGGTIEIRNPGLYVVDPGCPVTTTDKTKPGQPESPSDLGRLRTGR